MNRMEILRLALNAKKDPEQALNLAREMAAFIADDQPLKKADNAPQAPKMQIDFQLSLPSKGKMKNERQRWKAHELERAAALLDNGASYVEVARIMGRTHKAIQHARASGKFPVKIHKLNPINQLTGAMGAASRGYNISEETNREIFNKNAGQ